MRTSWRFSGIIVGTVGISDKCALVRILSLTPGCTSLSLVIVLRLDRQDETEARACHELEELLLIVPHLRNLLFDLKHAWSSLEDSIFL